MRRSRTRSLALLALAAALAATGATAPPTGAAPPAAPARATPPKVPVAVGYGGAVASADADASAAGIAVLRAGGNAVDAAVATAAALGVTEPYSAGIGGGGYFVYYDASRRRVFTVDGRETAPATADAHLFQENGAPIPFAEGQTSGLGVGVPGTPATWRAVLDSWGSRPLRTLLRPAEKLARDGFPVDATFRAQTELNEARFRDFPDTARLFLPGGVLPVVGSTFKNPELADTYAELGRTGTASLYRGRLAEDIVRAVRKPRGPGRHPRRAGRRPDHRGPRRVRRQAPGPHPGGLPRAGRLLDGPLVLGRHHRRRGPQHPGAFRPRRPEPGAVPAPVHRGQPDLLRGPRPVGRGPRVRGRAHPSAALPAVRRLRGCLIDPARALTSPLAPGDPRHPARCAHTGKAAPTTYEGRTPRT